MTSDVRSLTIRGRTMRTQALRRLGVHVHPLLLGALLAMPGAARAAEVATSPSGASAAGGSPIQPFVSPPVAKGRPLDVAAGHILIRIARGATVAEVERSAKSLGLSKRGPVYGSRWYTFGLPAGADPRAVASAAAALRGVAQATVDPIVTLLDHVQPRDPLYTPADGSCDPYAEVCTNQWGLFTVGAATAWHETTGSPSVIIAVLDSGVDLDHDDLFGNLWVNPDEIAGNGVDDDQNGLVDDDRGADFVGDNAGGPFDDPASQDGNPDIPEGGQWVEDPATVWGLRFEGDPAVGDADDNNGDGYADLGVFHGTAVAGIVAAMTDNPVPGTSDTFEGMAGACWSCRIMAVRMINAEGNAFASDAAAALRYATDMGADIAVASWGLPTDGLRQNSPEIAVLTEAVDYALAAGVVIVAAAGNSGAPGVHYPAADRRVIAVGGSSPADTVSSFSSYGHLTELPDNGLDDDGNGWVDDVVDVVAPAEGIWSSWVLAAYDSLVYEALLGLDGWPPGADTYGAADGTSFSTPLVAGYLGLILSRHPGATQSQLRTVLRSNALDLAPAGYDAQSGFGRLRMVVPASLPGTSNLTPLADIVGDQQGSITVPDTGRSGQESVTLDGSGSSDPDGSITAYRWNWLDAQGILRSGTGVRLSVQLLTSFQYTFTLTVEDDRGALSAPDNVVVTVTPKPGGKGKPTR